MDDFITARDCAEIIELAREHMSRATVTLDDESAVIEARSGSRCWLRYAVGGLVGRIGERISTKTGLPLPHAEALQVIHYAPGQEYRPHFDAYDLNTRRGQRWCRLGGQRIFTALLYLNAVDEGGETVFPRCGVSVAARAGRVVFFHNVGESLDKPHPGSLHGGAPVLQGEKWACNIWFHARPMTERQAFSPPLAAIPSPRGRSRVPPGVRQATNATTKGNSEVLKRNGVAIITNRASRLWAEALSALPLELIDGQSGESCCISYWDSYGGDQLPDSVDEYDRHIALVGRKWSNPLADKAALARAIGECSSPIAAPLTFETIESALAADSRADKLWFLKNAFGAGGKHMRCVCGSELATSELPKHFIIQEAVGDLALLDGRKFTGRVYLLLWQGQCWQFDEGFILLHGEPYDPDSTAYGVQIDHRGYHREDAAVRMYPLRAVPDSRRFLPGVHDMLHSLLPVLAGCMKACGAESYVLLGIDFLVQRSQRAVLLEINTMPNFVHSPRVNAEVNVPLFRETLNLMLLGESTRYEKMNGPAPETVGSRL